MTWELHVVCVGWLQESAWPCYLFHSVVTRSVYCQSPLRGMSKWKQLIVWCPLLVVTNSVFVDGVHYKPLFQLEYHLPFLSPLVKSAKVVTQGYLNMVGVVPDLPVDDTTISKEPHLWWDAPLDVIYIDQEQGRTNDYPSGHSRGYRGPKWRSAINDHSLAVAV